MRAKFKYALGDEVIDQVTGFTGIITGWVVYITGCNQALVQPRVKDGEFRESRWFDEDRLDLATAKAHLHTVSHAGPDAAAPIK